MKSHPKGKDELGRLFQELEGDIKRIYKVLSDYKKLEASKQSEMSNLENLNRVVEERNNSMDGIVESLGSAVDEVISHLEEKKEMRTVREFLDELRNQND